MYLQFDTNNTGYVGLVKEWDTTAVPFYNGTHKEIFNTNYFEIQWNPTPLLMSEVSSNQDNCYVDFQAHNSNDEFTCPPRYSLISSDGDEHWCYILIWSTTSKFRFSDAVAECQSRGDSLPIVNSEEMNDNLARFAKLHSTQGGGPI
ncbi:hypothetical protein PMAYCL1PPCAC_10584 [Pristionchus mayeri]|uniref:C-type lectin n=1 Tax=Pristionchus mayeri TaxID=1317129 RepID=A0AAN4ZIB6_9BILA|nr:hypothetical protein PMAYCL1PPCAC_10575 [Pristionchus mayeri]GMR40389.1 hypothetical protein PMAYCL1PPCAC_10584 [Pristionchus mayeri]